MSKRRIGYLIFQIKLIQRENVNIIKLGDLINKQKAGQSQKDEPSACEMTFQHLFIHTVSTMKRTAQQRVPLKNYTKWNKLLKVVIQSEISLYNKIKGFEVCVCRC